MADGSEDEDDLVSLREAALLSLKTKQASQSANKLTSNTTEDVGDEEYVPCNSIHQLVDLGTEEYSPSRPGLVDASGSAYVPSSSRPSLRVAPSVPTHLDKRNKETKVEPEKLKVPHADRQLTPVQPSAPAVSLKKESKDDETKPDIFISDSEQEQTDLLYGDLNFSLLNEDSDEDVVSTGKSARKPVRNDSKSPAHRRIRAPDAMSKSQPSGKPLQDARQSRSVGESSSQVPSDSQQARDHAMPAMVPVVPPMQHPPWPGQIPILPPTPSVAGWLPPPLPGLLPFHHLPVNAITPPIQPAYQEASYGSRHDYRQTSGARRRSPSRERYSARRDQSRHSYESSSSSSKYHSRHRYRAGRVSPESDDYSQHYQSYQTDRSSSQSSRVRPNNRSSPQSELRSTSPGYYRHSFRDRSGSPGQFSHKHRRHVCSRHRRDLDHASRSPSRSSQSPRRRTSRSPRRKHSRSASGGGRYDDNDTSGRRHRRYARTNSTSPARQPASPTERSPGLRSETGSSASPAEEVHSGSASDEDTDSKSGSQSPFFTRPLALSPPRARHNRRSAARYRHPHSDSRSVSLNQESPSEGMKKPQRIVQLMTHSPSPPPPRRLASAVIIPKRPSTGT